MLCFSPILTSAYICGAVLLCLAVHFFLLSISSFGTCLKNASGPCLTNVCHVNVFPSAAVGRCLQHHGPQLGGVDDRAAGPSEGRAQGGTAGEEAG